MEWLHVTSGRWSPLGDPSHWRGQLAGWAEGADVTEQGEQSTDPATLAGKLDHLFRTVHAPGGGEFSLEAVAKAIADRGGPTISTTYIWQLRRGHRTNPRMSHLEALAGFFGVDPGYFFPGELAAQMEADLQAAAPFRDPAVRGLASIAQGLTDPTLAVVLELLERLRDLEGAQPASA